MRIAYINMVIISMTFHLFSLSHTQKTSFAPCSLWDHVTELCGPGCVQRNTPVAGTRHLAQTPSPWVGSLVKLRNGLKRPSHDSHGQEGQQQIISLPQPYPFPYSSQPVGNGPSLSNLVCVWGDPGAGHTLERVRQPRALRIFHFE